MLRQGAGIQYLDGPRLARGFQSASNWVAAGRDELNRINVFPVPDGDTGTNFSLTLNAVSDALGVLGDTTLAETSTTAARAAVLGARGNSGMMLAHFLLGMSEVLGELDRATTLQVAAAVRHGAETLESSLDEPREGTILTVARDAAIAAEKSADQAADLGEFLRLLHSEAERVLQTTPELLAVLKQAGVVDAGGKGFVRMIEGFLRAVNGDPLLPAPPKSSDEDLPAALAEIVGERDFQYCTEVLVRGDRLPPANDVRSALHNFGGSVVVAVAGDILKLHVHTDTPDAVFSAAERWGSVTSRKAEDMRAQHRQLRHTEQRAVAVVTDSSNDLSDATLDRLGIIMVPHQVIFGQESFRDRGELKADEFYRRLANSSELPTTSQPAPAEFVRSFRAAREEAQEAVGILVSGALSGTYAAATTAVQMAGINGVHLLDSRSASLGVGLLVLRASELAEQGWGAAAIVAELVRVRDQSGGFLTVDRYENLIRSGRVSRGKAWLGEMLQIRPILEVVRDGSIQPIDRVRGQGQMIPRIVELLGERLAHRPKRVRFGVVHALAASEAERVAAALREAFSPLDVLVHPATGVIGTHVGEGAWAVFYQVEDGTPEMNVD